MTDEDKSGARATNGSDGAEENRSSDQGTQLNTRENETEPIDSEQSESDQGGSTGIDYLASNSNTTGNFDPAKNRPDSIKKEVENYDRGADSSLNSVAQNETHDTKETSVNEFSQAPESDNTTKIRNSIYGEGAKRKDEQLIGREKRLEDHPGAYQLREKSEDEDEKSDEG